MADGPPAAAEPETPSPSTRRGWRELPVLVGIAVLVAIAIKLLVVQAFSIPSASMVPTLLEGDRILVCRICLRVDDVDRGEVIVFEGPDGAEPDRGIVAGALHWMGEALGVASPAHDDFVKRVVGLGGDTVEIDRTGQLYVNGEAVDEPYLLQPVPRHDFPPTTVPDGMLFVLGDNRLHSGDSRFPPPGGLGYIPEDKVIGEAFVIAWPLGRIGGIG